MTSIPHTAEREALASRIYDVVIYHYGSTYSWQGNVPGAHEEALARHRQSGVEQVAALLEPVGEEMQPVAWRTRYRSEPGMIGHYPWTYTERIRGMRQEQYEYEPLYASPKTNGGMGS
jgi:hypothetical protein